MSTWSEALAEAKAGTGRANVLFVGDSYFEGQGAGARASRWVDLLVNGLRTTYEVDGSGLGWYRPRWSSQQNGVNWPAPTGTAAMSNSENYQCAHGTQPTNGQYLEWTVSGDSVDLVHATGSGAGSIVVAVDGSTVDTFSCNSTATYGNVRHYNLGSNGSHTFRVTSSGGTTGIDGIVVYSGDYSAGISYWECSRGGYLSSNFQPSTGAAQGWANSDAHLVIDSLYGNDYLTSANTPATAAARFAARVAVYKNLPNSPTIVALLYWGLDAMNGDNGLGYDHQDYRDAIQAVATTEGVQIINLADTYPTISSSYLVADNIHPNATGHQMLADVLLDELPGPDTSVDPGAESPYLLYNGTAWAPADVRIAPFDGGSISPAGELLFGPNGTHWPSDTPRTGHANVVDVACNWSAIATAIGNVSPSQAAAGTIIRVAPGTLPGTSDGVTSGATPVLQNVGSSSWSQKVLVAPRDGWGTVSIASGVRIHNVHGVTFARINATTIIFTSCSDMNWAQSKMNLGIKTFADDDNVTNCNMYEVAMLNSRADESDSCQYRASDGYYIKDCVWSGCYLAPLFRPTGSSAHLDTFQMFGGTESNHAFYRGLTLRDCIFFGSSNCALQGGGYYADDPYLGEAFVTLDHTMLLSQSLSVQLRYSVPENTDSGSSQAINGAGEPGPWYAYNSYLMGTLHSTQWNTVSNSRTNLGVSNSIINGLWMNEDWSSMTPLEFDELVGAEPNDAYLMSIWL